MEQYQVDRLFVLVGENPLPNYVAARSLLKESGTVYLVHSTDTTSKAESLKRNLPSIKTEKISLGSKETNSQYIRVQIQKKVEDILQNSSEKQTFGLNYTGGTKAMSVHSYRALFDVDGVDNPVFSYLDARNLQMLIDRGNDVPISEKINLKLLLKEIFELHDLRWEQEPVTQPVLPDLAGEFAKLHTDENLVTAWRLWCDRLLVPATKNLKKKSAKQPEWKWKKDNQIDKVCVKQDIARNNLNQVIQGYIDKIKSGDLLLEDFQKDNFQVITDLSDLQQNLLSVDDWENIDKLINILRKNQYLDEGEIELSLKGFAEKSRMKKSKHAAEWLNGIWLEYYVLHQLQQLSDEFTDLINDIGMSFEVKESNQKNHKFEFDVAFVINYQLFAISCTTDANKGLCKSKLFEAYIRARQLGGDEARAALVCCYENPEKLENELKVETEIKREDPKIAVFGCKQLDNLQIHFKEWIDNNNHYYKL